jgi:hypothetical protein
LMRGFLAGRHAGLQQLSPEDKLNWVGSLE